MLSGIHTNAHYAAALRQRIRDLIGAKQSGFMSENGGPQCTNVRIPDSLLVDVAGCPVCGNSVCADRGIHQSNREGPLRR